VRDRIGNEPPRLGNPLANLERVGAAGTDCRRDCVRPAVIGVVHVDAQDLPGAWSILPMPLRSCCGPYAHRDVEKTSGPNPMQRRCGLVALDLISRREVGLVDAR